MVTNDGRFKKGSKPWIAGKKHIEQSKKLMAKSWFKKGQSSWNKGKKMRSETFNSGRFKKGLNPWNKGKIGVMPIPWNKGLKGLYPIELREKMSKAHIGQIPWMTGKHHSEKTKKIISDTKKKMYLEGKITVWNKGLKGIIHSGTITKEKRKKIILPLKDSKPEIKIQNFLDNKKIFYEKHKYIDIKHSYQCDVFIPSKNLIIECDGDYWHGNPLIKHKWQNNKHILKNIKIDKLRTKELKLKGYKVLRIWEKDIHRLSLFDFSILIDFAV